MSAKQIKGSFSRFLLFFTVQTTILFLPTSSSSSSSTKSSPEERLEDDSHNYTTLTTLTNSRVASLDRCKSCRIKENNVRHWSLWLLQHRYASCSTGSDSLPTSEKQVLLRHQNYQEYYERKGLRNTKGSSSS